MNEHIRWISRRWWSNRYYILLLLVMTLVSSAVAIGYPFLFKKIVDLLQNILKNPANYPSPMKEVYRICWLFVGVGIAQIISSFYPALRAYMNQYFEHNLRMEFFTYCTKKDYKFFNHFRTGDLVTRLTNDLSDFPKIGWFLCSGIFRALSSFSSIFFSLIIMFNLHWKLTLLSIAPLPLMMVIFYMTSTKLYQNFQKNQQAISAINSQLEMSFSGVRIIKSFVCEEKYKRFFGQALQKRFKTEMSVIQLNAILGLIYQYIGYIAQISVIIFGGYLVVKGEISVGTFIVFYTYLSMMIYPLLDLPQLFVSGKQAFVCIDRLEEIKDFPTSFNEQTGLHKIDNIESIEFRDVSFQYSDKTNMILDKISFRIEKGEKVLLLGSIGTGKSTILGLLTGILKPESGGIFVNDIPISDIDLTTLRAKIGYVPQEPLLFTGSIRDNIHFGNESLEADWYEKILQASQMQNEIEQFKDKDETLLGQRGVSVSGGQKQRIAIARALSRKPELLIFDDITASLDADNEQKLWMDIQCIYPEVTCLMVSHRLSTLRYADSIIFLDSDHTLVKSSHDDLMATHPAYQTFMLEHERV
ncbi:MAG TPA: ABC transporter ATP-binding protein [Candidatus Cloacimonadota bacterium]|nr:ABC transporter ATP-binding protein [Candidatus Cloacimonadota bacterium]HPT72308.1 ABC transporter ATP-binding protein [Candidatus Cloacimonadota bacterium]